jgi:hypothetical protein
MSPPVASAARVLARLAIVVCVGLWSGSPARADTTTVVAMHFGDSGDVPVTGDWTGSGKTQIGVFRSSDATFYLGDVGGVAPMTERLGESRDVPISGDWTGSGRTQIGVYRPSNETFYLGDVNGISPVAVHFGDAGDVPITGDWTGSGRTQIGVYRPSDETFYLREVTPSPVPPPVVTIPVATPLPVLTQGPGARRRVSVRITITWTWNRGRTRLHEIRLGRLPQGAHVAVHCAGRGCPRRHSRIAAARRVTGLLRGLDGTVYRAGDRILITISAPGRRSERASVRIRAGRLPLAREL